ncbi:MAG: glycosyl transferase family 2 [Nitrospinae bacterium CG11_big_fil_rev_8_21_14_0_20_56_8]|nr:MAG: glycosyl transferase family 2 [Nitrospinae bacterium CG11_big_fil_rev_8_21_14_0_20_56_8]
MNVSIVIPTLNETRVFEQTLANVMRLPCHELIVVDGGSGDHTVDIARKFTPHVIQSPPGRAEQMNRGADQASGDLLLFLHADSWIRPESFLKMVQFLASKPLAVGGAFSLAIDSDRWSLKLISHIATLRARHLHLVYGDQAIFVRRQVFRDLGGFAPLPICEDLDFFRRLRKQGPVMLLDDCAFTSARRWITDGVTLTTLRNTLIAGLFLLGFSPHILSRWYLAVR